MDLRVGFVRPACALILIERIGTMVDLLLRWLSHDYLLLGDVLQTSIGGRREQQQKKTIALRVVARRSNTRDGRRLLRLGKIRM
jgi:hypothetical protein